MNLAKEIVQQLREKLRNFWENSLETGLTYGLIVYTNGENKGEKFFTSELFIEGKKALRIRSSWPPPKNYLCPIIIHPTLKDPIISEYDVDWCLGEGDDKFCKISGGKIQCVTGLHHLVGIAVDEKKAYKKLCYSKEKLSS